MSSPSCNHRSCKRALSLRAPSSTETRRARVQAARAAPHAGRQTERAARGRRVAGGELRTHPRAAGELRRIAHALQAQARCCASEGRDHLCSVFLCWPDTQEHMLRLVVVREDTRPRQGAAARRTGKGVFGCRVFAVVVPSSLPTRKKPFHQFFLWSRSSLLCSHAFCSSSFSAKASVGWSERAKR